VRKIQDIFHLKSCAAIGPRQYQTLHHLFATLTHLRGEVYERRDYAGRGQRLRNSTEGISIHTAWLTHPVDGRVSDPQDGRIRNS
jgi:hypothetical protein